jgi:uncharacterized protein YbdZ (MbtH family)
MNLKIGASKQNSAGAGKREKSLDYLNENYGSMYYGPASLQNSMKK